MITEFINGRDRLTPLGTGEDWIKEGRVITVMPTDPSYANMPILYFYKCVNDVGGGRFQFETIRIRKDTHELHVIPGFSQQQFTTYTRGSFHNGCQWGWFEIHEELKYDPNQQGDTDEDI